MVMKYSWLAKLIGQGCCGLWTFSTKVAIWPGLGSSFSWLKNERVGSNNSSH